MQFGNWKEPETFEEWVSRWCRNCRGERNLNLATEMMYQLPHHARLLGHARNESWILYQEDIPTFQQHFYALEFAMVVALSERDDSSTLGRKATRTVFELVGMWRATGKHLMLPVIESKPGDHSSSWDWEFYRQLPERLIRFFGNSAWYPAEKVQEKAIAELAPSLVSFVFGDENQGAFDCPDILTEPLRGLLLRTLILTGVVGNWGVTESLEKHGLLDDCFELLRVARSRQSKDWPVIYDEHWGDIDDQVYRIGVRLGKPASEIELPVQ